AELSFLTVLQLRRISVRRMRYAVAAITIALTVVVILTRPSVAPPKSSLHGIPISMIANGKPEPRIGLFKPLPSWIPLPETGFVTGAGLYPPQQPFGPAAVVMVRYEEPAGEFAANYR